MYFQKDWNMKFTVRLEMISTVTFHFFFFLHTQKRRIKQKDKLPTWTSVVCNSTRNAYLWTGSHAAVCVCCVCPAVRGCCKGQADSVSAGRSTHRVISSCSPHSDQRGHASSLSNVRRSGQSALTFKKLSG